jgi:hypothetical protein
MDNVNGEGGKLKEKVEEWKRFMLKNPPSKPEVMKLPEDRTTMTKNM